MKPARSVALVCSGRISRSGLTRLRRLPQVLGWVKASTVSVASRAANSLGGGIPVLHYEDLNEAHLVMVSVPDAIVRSTISELIQSKLVWPAKTVILFDSKFDSHVLEPLALRGADTGSLHPIGNRFAVEGDKNSVRLIRRVLQDQRTRLLEMHRGARAEFLRGVDATTGAFLPQVAKAVEHFTQSGLSRAESERLTAELLESTVKLYFRAGKRTLKT